MCISSALDTPVRARYNWHCIQLVYRHVHRCARRNAQTPARTAYLRAPVLFFRHLRRPCGQISHPPQSRQYRRWRSCGHICEPVRRYALMIASGGTVATMLDAKSVHTDGASGERTALVPPTMRTCMPAMACANGCVHQCRWWWQHISYGSTLVMAAQGLGRAGPGHIFVTATY